MHAQPNFQQVNEARKAAQKLGAWKAFFALYFGKKIYLQHEWHEGWKLHEGRKIGLPFYLFWCRSCEHWSKDYPHGHIERQYLNCSYCNQYHRFVPFNVELRMFWELFKMIRRVRAIKSK